MKRYWALSIVVVVISASIPLALAIADDPPSPSSPSAEQTTEINGATVAPIPCPESVPGDCVVVDAPADNPDSSPLEERGGRTAEGMAAVCDAMGPDYAADNPMCKKAYEALAGG